MANTALYRVYRPEEFDDVVGQVHITKTLKNEVLTGQIGHAYLFYGGRGTGKTSTARILSRAVNCENPQDGNPCNKCHTCRGILSGEILDVIEIDAASNNGVDNIRELREEARFCAAACKVKVYIIDEVHMLSAGAFNALLKLLEEPPAGVMFILATTELTKVPATILSRCQRFDFHRIGTDDITQHLLRVAKKENIDIDTDAAEMIARASDGALRDALSILDKCRANGEKITVDLTSDMLGVVQKTFLYQVARSISTDDAPRAIALLDEYIKKGQSATRFIEMMIDYMRSLLMCRVTNVPRQDMSAQEFDELSLVAAEFSKEKLIRCINILLETVQSIKAVANARVLVDVCVLKMCMPAFTDDYESVQARIAELERKISQGKVYVQKPQQEEKPVEKTSAEEAPEVQDKKKQEKKPVVPAPITGKLKEVEKNWREICKSISQLRLMIALERAKITCMDDTLVLLYNDTDKIMLEFLRDKKVMASLKEHIEKFTGFAPEIAIRLESEYDPEEKAPKTDPLSELEEINLDEQNDIEQELAQTQEVQETDDEEDDEEYSFEEPDDDEE